MADLTEGTWQLGETEDGDSESGPTGISVWDGTIIAMRADDEGFPEGEWVANVYRIADARAMAAAKDLVEALELMLDWHTLDTVSYVAKYGYGRTQKYTYDRVRAAIAKARGTEEHVCRAITIGREWKP